MALYGGPHRLKSRLCKPDYSVMVLALNLDPALANKAAQYHFACRDWKAVGKLQSVKLKCCMMARWVMFGPLPELSMVISPLPLVQLYKPADCLKIA